MKLNKIWLRRKTKSSFSFYIGELTLGLALLPLGLTCVQAQTGPIDIYDFRRSSDAPDINVPTLIGGFNLSGNAEVTINNNNNLTSGQPLLIGQPHIFLEGASRFNFIESPETLSSLVSNTPPSPFVLGAAPVLNLNNNDIELNLTPTTSIEDPTFTVGQNDVFTGNVLGASTAVTPATPANVGQLDLGRLTITGQDGTQTQTFTGALNLTGGQVDNGFDSTGDGVVDQNDFNLEIGNDVSVIIDNSALRVANSVLIQDEANLNLLEQEDPNLNDEEITDLLIQGSGSGVFSDIAQNGVLNSEQDRLVIRDAATIDGVLNLSAPTDPVVSAGINIGEITNGGGVINANGNDVVIGNEFDADPLDPTFVDQDTTNVDITGTGDLIRLGDGNLTFTNSLSHTGATFIGGGETTIFRSNTTEIIVSGRTDSPEAFGDAESIGAISADVNGEAEGGNLEFLPTEVVDNNSTTRAVYGHELTSAPSLILEGQVAAETITIGSTTNSQNANSGVNDLASITTNVDAVLSENADVTIYRGGSLNLGGEESFDQVIFGATTGSQSLEGVVNVEAAELTINTLNGRVEDPTTVSNSATNPHGIVNLDDSTLNLGGDGSSFRYNGIINGTQAAVVNLNGAGEIVFSDIQNNNDYDFDGVYNVNEGILEIQDVEALGSNIGNTVIVDGAELHYNGNGLNSPEPVLISGFGIASVDGNLTGGSLTNEVGNNTHRGSITLDGDASIFAAEDSTFQINGVISSTSDGQDDLFTGGSGDIIITSPITNDLNDFYHNGPGFVDIGRQDNQYTGNTFIEGGTVFIDGDPTPNNSSAANTLGQLGSEVVFVGDTAQGEVPVLEVDLSTNEIFNRDIVIDGLQSRLSTGESGRDIAILRVNSEQLTIDLAETSIEFADPTNALYQEGAGILRIDASSSIATAMSPGQPTIVSSGTPSNIGFVPQPVELDGIINSANGTLQIQGPGRTGSFITNIKGGEVEGSSQLLINGLGTLDEFDISNNIGSLAVSDFDALVVRQVVDGTFDGVINSDADFVFSPQGGVLTLGENAIGDGFQGNIIVGSGTLVFTGENTFGSSGDDPFDEATLVCGSTDSNERGVLGVSGNFETEESITLINDAGLQNFSGINTFLNPINIFVDPDVALFTEGPESFASIGAVGGQLNIGQGVNNESGIPTGLRLNAIEGENGVLNMGQINADFTDIVIGNAGSTGVVNLLTENTFTGSTFLEGGNVNLENANAFSSGTVVVNEETSLSGAVNLDNAFTLNDTLVTSESAGGTLTLSGVLSGTGGVTQNSTGGVILDGQNNFTGDLTVLRGSADVTSDTTPANIIVQGLTGSAILNHQGATDTGSITVNGGTATFGSTVTVDEITIGDAGTLNTTGAGQISDNATAVVNGTLNLGGADGVSAISGDGTVLGDLTVASNASISPGNDGVGNLTVIGNLDIDGVYNVDLTSLADAGSDTITVLNGNVSLDRATSIINVEGASELLSELGTRINIIDVNEEAGRISSGVSEVQVSGDARVLFDLATGDLISIGEDFANDAGSTANQQDLFSGILDAATDGDNIDTTTAAGAFFNEFAILNIDTLSENLDAIGPEGYIGAIDYALESLESYSLAARTSVSTVLVSSRRASSTSYDYGFGYGESGYNTNDYCEVEVFGGWNSFSAGSDFSTTGQDYDISGNGGYVGANLCASGGNFKLGGYFGFDSGTVDSQFFNLDTTGLIFGAFLDYKTPGGKFIFRGDVSFGNYSFDGTHTAIGATAGASFDSSAFRAGAGLDYLLYDNGGLKVLPSVSITSLSTEADRFSESGQIPLEITDLSASSVLLDAGLKFELSSSQSFIGLTGYIGYQQDFGDTDREVSANIFGANFLTTSPGAESGGFVYNVGGFWDITDSVRVNAHYFGESRDGSESNDGFNAGVSISF